MRALIQVAAIASLVLSGTVVAAADQPSSAHGEFSIPNKHFTMLVHGRYGSQFTTVYRDGKDWACVTESMPYAVAPADPLKGLNWSELETDARASGKDTAKCRDEVTIDDRRGSPPKRLKACLIAPAFAALNSRLAHLCRAE